MERLLTPEGMTVAILGMGNIGEKIAELLQPWKPNIIGVSRTRRENPYAAEAATLADLAERSGTVRRNLRFAAVEF